MTTPDTAVQTLTYDDMRRLRTAADMQGLSAEFAVLEAAADRALRAPPDDDPRWVIEALFAIQVEKLLLAKLGRNWTPAGISIESLVDELAARAPAGAPISQPEAGLHHGRE